MRQQVATSGAYIQQQQPTNNTLQTFQPQTSTLTFQQVFFKIFCDSCDVLKYEIFFQLAFPQKLRPLLYIKLFESFKMSTHMIYHNLKADILLSDWLKVME